MGTDDARVSGVEPGSIVQGTIVPVAPSAMVGASTTDQMLKALVAAQQQQAVLQREQTEATQRMARIAEKEAAAKFAYRLRSRSI